jgi:hypothetical protein
MGAVKNKAIPSDLRMPFFRFIVTDKSCVRFLLASTLITIIYFILLRVLFMMDSTWWDTLQYVQTTDERLEVNTRPLGYSNFIGFVHAISYSDGVLIFSQYISNIVANLFLFFTLLYFFPLKKGYRVVLFILLICNPLYALYSNYILSDALFCSLSVIWFTILIWIMYRPRWILFFIQLVLLYWTFLLRYNALIYPFLIAIAYLLSKQAIWKKIVSITISFLLIIEIIISVIHVTKDKTGVATFSALGGWQLASNSMFVLKHVKFDSTTFTTKTSKKLCGFVKHYFSSKKMLDSLTKYEDTDIHAQFIWNRISPLIHYAGSYFPRFYATHPPPKNSNRYVIYDHYVISWNSEGPIMGLKKRDPQNFITSWTTMAPIYEEFGIEVIKKYPLEYLHYFIWPNIKIYFYPPMEAYVNYNHYRPFKPLLTGYYHFTPDDFDKTHQDWIRIFMYPWSWIFTLINILFLLLTFAYYFTHCYKNDAWFNQCLIFYLFFYVSNFFFSILIAPNVFRYQITIITLSLSFIIYLWQKMFSIKNNIRIN